MPLHKKFSVNPLFLLELTEDILKEGEQLKREIEKEENENELRLTKSLESQGSTLPEMRYKRLMCLLDRSKFYANFLLQRMATKKEEEKSKVSFIRRIS